MKILASLLIVLASARALFGQVGVLAGPVTNQANGHIYYLLAPSDWYSARASASRLGGHLVTIQDTDENAWIRSTFGTYDGVSRNLWLGLTDQGHEGEWAWVTGEPLIYTNWADGEPNDLNGDEDFAHMWYFSDQWNDGTVYFVFGSPFAPQGVVEVEPRTDLGPLTIRVSEVELKWLSVSNQLYQLQYRSELTTNAWVNLFGTNVVGDGTTIRFTEKVVEGAPSKYYRVLSLTNSIPQ